jgi:uncharacterized protein (DUF2141 family)
MLSQGRLRGIVWCLLSGAIVTVTAARVGAQSRGGTASLVIDVTGFADASGQATIVLVDSKEAFDGIELRDERRNWKNLQRDLADLPIVRDVDGFSAKHRVNKLQPGEYVAFVYHDRNLNGKLDANIVGIPQEPFGMSNNFRPKLFPVPQKPTWSRLAFVVRNGGNRIGITMRN